MPAIPPSISSVPHQRRSATSVGLLVLEDELPRTLKAPVFPASIGLSVAEGVPFPAITPPPASDLSRSRFGSSFAECAPALPQLGDTLLGFRLVEELGHGTFARVFLAKQEILAGREVALKVSLKPTREPERLARLQHTNVVPVYSVHTAGSTQLICMPFLGRRTLADLLVGYRKSHVAGLSTRKAIATRRGSTKSAESSVGNSGRSSTASHTSADDLASRPADDAADPLIGNVPAVLRVLAQLAEGLAHAHARGILHLDLKPANILFADTGEPMLLDFNLSYDATESERELIGGTIPYMAPEQLLDLKSRGKGGVDARTDLYSLGAVAFELLTSTQPFSTAPRTLAEFDRLMADREKGPPPLAERNPDATPAVEAMIRKLLAPNPADRYQTAADLRDDLERQLTHRPLRFARERSVNEQFRKWRRRNPRAVMMAILAGVLAIACGTGAAAYSESRKASAGEARERAARTRAALAPIRLDLILPGDRTARARGTTQALDLLRVYGLPDDPKWYQRSAFQQVPVEDRPAVAGDLGELLLLLAQARWEDGRGVDQKGAAADVRVLLQQAETCYIGEPPAFLSRLRTELDAANGLLPLPNEPKAAVSAQDHFLDAVGLIREAKYTAATARLEQAAALQPDHAAAHFLAAWCRVQNRAYPEAIERFRLVKGQLPTDPRPAYWIGMSYVRLSTLLIAQKGRYAEAEKCFSEAIRQAPDFAAAYYQRGNARLRQAKYHEAEHDFTAALNQGGAPIPAYMLRSEVRKALGNEAGAIGDRIAAEQAHPEGEEDLLIRGWGYLPEKPEAALADLRAAEKINPKSHRALQNQAHILAEHLGDDAGALIVIQRLMKLYPDTESVRLNQAYLLARLNRHDEARREAASIREVAGNPNLTYKLGCLYALTSAAHPEDRAQAISYLKMAFSNGYRNTAYFSADNDLCTLQCDSEFVEFARSVEGLYSQKEVFPDERSGKTGDAVLDVVASGNSHEITGR